MPELPSMAHGAGETVEVMFEGGSGVRYEEKPARLLLVNPHAHGLVYSNHASICFDTLYNRGYYECITRRTLLCVFESVFWERT